MTTITIDLSKENEAGLKKIMKANPDLKTLEEALLWCLQQSTNPVLSVLSYLPEDKTTLINLGTSNRKKRTIPDFPPRITPTVIKKNERALVITGKDGEIDNLISKLSKDLLK